MSKQKMNGREYTAEEMREMAGHLIVDICDTENECNEYRNAIGSFDLIDCELALSQAADMKDRVDKEYAAMKKNIAEWPKHGEEQVFAHQLLWMLERIRGDEMNESEVRDGE